MRDKRSSQPQVWRSSTVEADEDVVEDDADKEDDDDDEGNDMETDVECDIRAVNDES